MIAKPIKDKILVLPFPPKETTESGIIIPESLRVRPSRATVISVGKGMKGRAMEIEEGDVVFHIEDAGTPLQKDGVTYYILSDSDIHCRIPKTN